MPTKLALSNAIRRVSASAWIVSGAVLVAWAPIVAGTRSVFGWDLFWQHVPFRAWSAAVLKNGDLPLWAPGIGAGYALHANGEAALLSPIELIASLLLPAHRATDATFVLSSLVGGLLALRLARTIGASPAAACLAGIAWGLSGRFTGATWPNSAIVTALLPGILLSLEGIRRAPHARAPVVGLAATLGFAVLAGRAQTLLVSVPLILAWVVAGLVVDLGRATREGRPFAAELRTRLGPLALGTALGLGIGAPQALPTLLLVSQSERQAGLPLDLRAMGSLGANDLLRVFLPVGSRYASPQARAHVGVVTIGIVLAGLAWAAVRRSRQARPIAAALLGAVLLLLLALGQKTPLFGLLSLIPPWHELRGPSRFLTPYALCLALAAGPAFDVLMPVGSRWWRLRWGVVALAAVELVGAAWLTIPWVAGTLYSAAPRVLDEVRALPLDPAGAPYRHVALGCRADPPLGVLGFDRERMRGFIERFDPVAKDRALLHGTSSANLYGLPQPQWQWRFLATLTPARLDSLGVAIAFVCVPDGVSPVPTVRVVRRPLPSLRPRALLVPEAAFGSNLSAAQEALEQHVGGELRTVALEDSAAVALPQGRFAPRPARITSSRTTSLTVEASTPQEGWLVVFDTWDPGWTARIDGQETPVRRAFGFFRAVHVPRGDSTVVFSYRPPGLGLGLAAAAIGLLGLLSVVRRRAD